MNEQNKQKHIPKHGQIRSKTHTPKHLSAEPKREKAGWWLFVAAVVSVVLCVVMVVVDVPFSLLWGYLGMLAVSAALMIFALLKITKNRTFPGIAALAISANVLLYHVLCLWFFFYSYAVLCF